MAVGGIPVVIVDEGGVPVRPVDAMHPLMTVAENGLGLPITISDLGTPFIVDGYGPVEALLALSSDDGSNITDDDDQIMETYNGNSTA